MTLERDLSFLDHDNPVLRHEAIRLNQLIYSRPEFDRGAFQSLVMRRYFDFKPQLTVQRQALKKRLRLGSV
jgi:hypothetical protein